MSGPGDGHGGRGVSSGSAMLTRRRSAFPARAALFAAGLSLSLACGNRSPTSPENGTDRVTGETARADVAAAAARPALRPRAPIVIAPRGVHPLPPGVWGSDDANLTIAENGATIQILSSGGCYGVYGDIRRSIPDGRFDLPGIHTQLIGAYPGMISYAAQYSGIVQGGRMSMTVFVPELGKTFGPFLLVSGIHHSWSRCLYP